MNEFIQFAKELADASGEISCQYFRIPMMVETKADKTPVTAADRKAEITMSISKHIGQRLMGAAAKLLKK